MFGTIPSGVPPEKIQLRSHEIKEIDIYFVEKTLFFDQEDRSKLSVKMMIGVIDE